MRYAHPFLIVAALSMVAAGPADPAKVDAVLELLHARGADLTSFTADVKMVDDNVAMGGNSTRNGTAQYQVKPDGQPRLHVDLTTRHFANKPPTPDEKEYLLDDGWLTDRNYHDRNEVRRQVARPGQKTDLFNLGKGGAFPLPIGQDPAAVHKAFDVAIMPAEKTDPPGTVHLELTPKVNTSLAKQYAAVEVWVDTAQRMPVRVQTYDKAGVTDRTVEFTNLKVNPPLPASTFVLRVDPTLQSAPDVVLPPEGGGPQSRPAK